MTRLKRSKKATAAEAGQVAREMADRTYDQPGEKETKSLQFKVTPSLHTEFKTYAAARDMKMVDLFKVMYDEYKTRHEGSYEDAASCRLD